jgi:hypothetical protein
MSVLESKLVIGAKDETGGAFAAIKAHIASLDKQISTFDKMAASVGKISKSTDPMITSINASVRAMNEARGAVVGLAEGADVAAGAQRTLGEAIMSTTRMMVAQGVEAARVAGKIVASQKGVAKGAVKAAAEGGGVLGIGAVGGAMLGGALPALAAGYAGWKTLEASASLEQMKLRVREVSGGDKTESSFAEALAAEVAQKYPAITQAKALETYNELRPNAGNPVNQEIARRNLMTVSQAQTAALAIGTEITPEDAQNLLKAVEGSGRAGDPTAVGKMFDSYIRAKQVFGSAIDSSKVRDYVQNAKGANFGIGEDQFFWQNIVRMTEGNASRLGNETAQTLQTLVGGHATKQTARWLVDMGLATGFTPQGGGAATIHGLQGSDVLQVNQLDWANQVLLPALQKHGVLSEENIAKREALLRKDNPNIDERAARERAEAGLISSAVARSGMRTTVTDNLSHAIANELLISRDVQQMKGASGLGAAADVGKNPIAAMKEFTGSIENFASVVGGPLMAPAAKALDALAHGIESLTKALANGTLVGDVKEDVKQARIKAIEEQAKRPPQSGDATNAFLDEVFGIKHPFVPPSRPFSPTPEHHWGPWHAGGTPSGPIMPKSWTPSGVSLSGGADNAKLAAAAAMPVNISGQAELQQTLNITIQLDPEIRAQIMAARSASVTIPLIGGGSGRMDSDAGPHRSGIGSM